MLPDGSVLFTAAGGNTSSNGTKPDRGGVVDDSRAQDGVRRRQRCSLSAPAILCTAGGVLFAIPFDMRRLEVSGGPTPIVEGIRRAVVGATGVAFFDVSDNGSLIYATGPVTGSAAASDVTLIDITTGIGTPLKLPPASYEFPRVSPDGKRIAVHADDGKDANVWIDDLSRATSVRRLTNGGRNRGKQH
jgi:serine/threonine-protein kinase